MCVSDSVVWKCADSVVWKCAVKCCLYKSCALLLLVARHVSTSKVPPVP